MTKQDVSEQFKSISVLYVEDDSAIRESLARILKRKLDSLYFAENGQEGYELFLKHRPSLVITDISMPVMNGLEMAELIKSIDKDIPIIVTTAYDDISYLLKAIEVGINQYVFKPISIDKLYGSIEKCSEMVLLEGKIRRQNTLIQNILNFQSNMLIVTDGYEVVRCNQAFLDCCNAVSLEDFHKKHQTVGELFIKEEGFISDTKKSNWLKFILKHTNKKYKVRMFNHNREEYRIYLLKLNPLPDSTDQYIVSFTDITILEWERKDLELQSITDPLTQVYNRLKFNNSLEKELIRARRYGIELSLIMLDIDHFKRLNDKFGHLAGDSVLIEVSKLIKNNIRALDIFARWGGEEFMILTPETNSKGASLLAEKLRGLIEQHDFKEVGKVTCSFGVCQFLKDESFDDFTKRVDDAMYLAKNEGRNRVVVF